MDKIRSNKIFSLFKKLNDRPFIFVKPSGNFGDELIWRGAEKIAKLAKLSFKTVEHAEFMASSCPEETVIYIHGGGGFNNFWSGSVIQDFIKAAYTHKGPVIQGPQTFIDDPVFIKKEFVDKLPLATLNKNIHLFVRESTSLRALKDSLPSWIDLEDDHDTATNLEPADLLKRRINKFYTFYAIREDKESSIMKFRSFLAVGCDPVRHCRDFSHWLHMHTSANEIITNRLHSSIIGSIFGIRTTLLPNSYHKNRSVWEYSLKDRGVEFSNSIPSSALDRWYNRFFISRKVMYSYKVQNSIKKFYALD